LSAIAQQRAQGLQGEQTALKRLRVGVIYGGRSGEHEVSLASAAAVFTHLDRSKYEPVPIRVDKDGRWTIADKPPSAMSAAETIEHARLEAAHTPQAIGQTAGGHGTHGSHSQHGQHSQHSQHGAPHTHGASHLHDRRNRNVREVYLVAHPSEETILSIDRRARAGADAADSQALVTGMGLDVMFPVMHGPYGEDGTVQGLLELANLPYIGCGVLASAVGMDKAMMKVVFAARGLPIVDYVVIRRGDWLANPDAVLQTLPGRLAFPLFVKPANLGSSVGISKVKAIEELRAAIDLAAEYDRKILVESGVPNPREIECAVLGNDDPQVSVAGEIIPSREFYDYESKYLDEGSRTLIPADLPAPLAEEIRQLARSAFLAIDGAGMARVDFLLERDRGRLYVNEVNTIPGFTTISMYSKLWQATGVEYPQLLDRLVQLALERHGEKQQLRTSVT
jgi:D-alanine-D-alanine ligase